MSANVQFAASGSRNSHSRLALVPPVACSGVRVRWYFNSQSEGLETGNEVYHAALVDEESTATVLRGAPSGECDARGVLCLVHGPRQP